MVLSPGHSTIPQGLKDAIVAILDERPTHQTADIPDGARLESHGHYGGGFGNIGKLELELLFLAKEPVVASPAV